MPDKFIGYRIKLYPTEDQIKLFNEYFGVSRAAYNLGLELQNKKYEDYLDGKSDKSTYSFFELNNEVRRIKKTDEKYSWMLNYNSETISASLKDLMYGFKMFFCKQSRRPKFKSKKRSGLSSFPTRSDRLLIEKDKVRLSSIGYVYAEDVPDKILGYSNKNCQSHNFLDYSNARIVYDGLYYYLTLEVKVDIDNHDITYNSNYKYKYNEEYQSKERSRAIGIDLGCSWDNWIVMSDGYRKGLPDFSKENKKIKRLMKKAARQRKLNNTPQGERTNPTLGYKGPKEFPIKSKNESKTIAKINKYYKRISNKRNSAIYDACKHILDVKPEAVVMEDIRTYDMVDSVKKEGIPKFAVNQYTNKILIHTLCNVKTRFTYVLESNDIPLYLADEDYPSTQICSRCGNRQNIGRKKTYVCPVCGLSINRDDNAAINLSNWYYSSCVN